MWPPAYGPAPRPADRGRGFLHPKTVKEYNKLKPGLGGDPAEQGPGVVQGPKPAPTPEGPLLISNPLVMTGSRILRDVVRAHHDKV